MKFRSLLLLTILLLISINTNAQTLGGSLMIGLPQGEFKEKVDRLGYGLQVHGTIWSPSKLRPFTVGFNLGYMVYGEESFKRRFSLTNPDVYVDVNRTNSLVNFHLLFQVSPFTGTVRPYVEGLFGGAYVFTSTTIKNEWNDDDVASSTNFDDYAWNYGGGAGLLIRLTGDMGDVSSLYLDLKARYLFGSETEYLAEGSITVDQQNGSVYYDVLQSRTDILILHLGVVAYF